MRQGRYSRSRWDWGRQPSRSAEVAAAVAADTLNPTKRAPGRKAKSWCKPNRGPHTPVMVKAKERTGSSCHWRLSWAWRSKDWTLGWLCFHQEECSGCGKVIRVAAGQDCPDWRPVRPEEQQAFDVEIARRVGVEREWTSRKPAVTGPQGYRRPRT